MFATDVLLRLTDHRWQLHRTARVEVEIGGRVHPLIYDADRERYVALALPRGHALLSVLARGYRGYRRQIELAGPELELRASVGPVDLPFHEAANGVRVFHQLSSDVLLEIDTAPHALSARRAGVGPVGLSRQAVAYTEGLDEGGLAVAAAACGFDVVRRLAGQDAWLLYYRGSSAMALLENVRRLGDHPGMRSAVPDVIYRVFTQNMKDPGTPADYLYPEQPELHVAGCRWAWARRRGDPKVRVAVVDPHGVSPDHPSVAGRFVANYDFVNRCAMSRSALSGMHGTKCAATAAGGLDDGRGTAGVAGGSSLIGVRIPEVVHATDLADILRWTAGLPVGRSDFPPQLDRGADVISNSWNLGRPDLDDYLRQTIVDIVREGRRGRGCVVCFAAGNVGYQELTEPLATLPGVIAVGASIARTSAPCESADSDHRGRTQDLPVIADRRAYYSPYGERLTLVAPSHPSYTNQDQLHEGLLAPANSDGAWIEYPRHECEVAARLNDHGRLRVRSVAGFASSDRIAVGRPGQPGFEVTTIADIEGSELVLRRALAESPAVGTPVATGPALYDRNFGGTSHSCAMVAGAAALILAARDSLSATDVRDILCRTAEKIDPAPADAKGAWLGEGEHAFSLWYGHGRLDVGRAVERAESWSAPSGSGESQLAAGVATRSTSLASPAPEAGPELRIEVATDGAVRVDIEIRHRPSRAR